MSEEILSRQRSPPQEVSWIGENGQSSAIPEELFLSEDLTESQAAEAWAIIEAMSASARRVENSIERLQSRMEGMSRKVDEISGILKTARVESIHA